MTQANDILKRLHGRSPAGFAIGLHIQFTTPRYFFQSYPKDWLEHYSAAGLLLSDPTVHWGFSNAGVVRWSALAASDGLGVLQQAARFGLNFGCTVAVDRSASRTIASFARPDREMTDIELAALQRDLKALHDETLAMMVLSPDIHETLRQMSIYLTHG